MKHAWWLLAPVLALIAYRTIVEAEFVADASFLILENRYMRAPGMFWENVVHNYFWSSSGNSIPYWRPVTKGSWYLEYQVFGPDASGFMAVQLIWHLLGVVGVQALGRRLGLQQRWAALAAVLYALHPAAIAPVGMLMARSDVAGASALIWALVAWLRWRDTGHNRWAALHVFATLLALGSKESTVVLPVLLLGWSLLHREFAEAWRRMLVQLAPSVVLGGAYMLTRRALLRADSPGMESVAVDWNPLRWFASLTMYLRALWPLRMSSGIRDVSAAEAASTEFVVVGVVTLVVAAAFVTWAVRSKRADVAFAIIWVVIAVGPVVLTKGILVPATELKFPIADRWLYHALAPASLAWARLFQAVPWPRIAVGIQAAAALWAGVILWTSRASTAEFITEAGMLDNEDRQFYAATPERFRTNEDTCLFQERKLVRAQMRHDSSRVESLARDILARCGPSGERNYWLFSALVDQKRYQEAEPLARELIERPPRDRRGHASLTRMMGVVFLHTGHAEESERWLLKSLELGIRGCDVLILLAESARAQSKRTVAAEWLGKAFECGGNSDPSLLLMASTWLLEAGDRASASKLLRQATTMSLTSDQVHQADILRRALGESSGGAQPKR